MARFSGFMKYKSEEVGIKFLLVPVYNTSQINCLTGKKFSEKLQLSVRQVTLCQNITMNRDVNAAINIAKRVRGEWFIQNGN